MNNISANKTAFRAKRLNFINIFIMHSCFKLAIEDCNSKYLIDFLLNIIP